MFVVSGGSVTGLNPPTDHTWTVLTLYWNITFFFHTKRHFLTVFLFILSHVLAAVCISALLFFVTVWNWLWILTCRKIKLMFWLSLCFLTAFSTDTETDSFVAEQLSTKATTMYCCHARNEKMDQYHVLMWNVFLIISNVSPFCIGGPPCNNVSYASIKSSSGSHWFMKGFL